MEDKANQRIAIMQDVLIQLNREDNPMHINTGSYLGGDIPESLTINANIQQDVEIIQKYCDVCFKACVFLSRARVYNEVYEPNCSSSRTYYRIGALYIMKNLTGIFSTRQLDVMECAFEQESGFACNSSQEEWDEADRAVIFGKMYDNPRDRARAIAENVIANNGLFVP